MSVAIFQSCGILISWRFEMEYILLGWNWCMGLNLGCVVRLLPQTWHQWAQPVYFKLGVTDQCSSGECITSPRLENGKLRGSPNAAKVYSTTNWCPEPYSVVSVYLIIIWTQSRYLSSYTLISSLISKTGPKQATWLSSLKMGSGKSSASPIDVTLFLINVVHIPLPMSPSIL